MTKRLVAGDRVRPARHFPTLQHLNGEIGTVTEAFLSANKKTWLVAVVFDVEADEPDVDDPWWFRESELRKAKGRV